jgi:hypothetical protein
VALVVKIKDHADKYKTGFHSTAQTNAGSTALQPRLLIKLRALHLFATKKYLLLTVHGLQSLNE